MLPAVCTWEIFATTAAAGPPLALGGASGFPMTLSLQRAFPMDKRVEVVELMRAHDRERHGRLLQSQNHAIEFPVGGGLQHRQLYYATVKLGTPAQEFHVQIDTGSDVLWLSCTSCFSCPTSTDLKIVLNRFDMSKSSSASTISCSDKCNVGGQSSDGLSNTNRCSYQFTYQDGSTTSGYYVYDVLNLGDVTTTPTPKIVFGCSTEQTGSLTNKETVVDGIFGFGQGPMSVISQLRSQGIVHAFSHCLRGDPVGGGKLVLGEIADDNMVYTPLHPNYKSDYMLYLENIYVDGQILDIDPSVFETSTTSGTIIDSGTALAYFTEGAYEPFIDAINSVVDTKSKLVGRSPIYSDGNPCYQMLSSSVTVDDVFPKVTLNFRSNFEGDGIFSPMHLSARDYLLEHELVDGAQVWCMGIYISPENLKGIAILGDLFLHNKAVVYDLARQQIGWVEYDCSGSVYVTVDLPNPDTGSITNQICPSDNSSTTEPPLSAWILSLIMALVTCLV